MGKYKTDFIVHKNRDVTLDGTRYEASTVTSIVWHIATSRKALAVSREGSMNTTAATEKRARVMIINQTIKEINEGFNFD